MRIGPHPIPMYDRPVSRFVFRTYDIGEKKKLENNTYPCTRKAIHARIENVTARRRIRFRLTARERPATAYTRSTVIIYGNRFVFVVSIRRILRRRVLVIILTLKFFFFLLHEYKLYFIHCGAHLLV